MGLRSVIAERLDSWLNTALGFGGTSDKLSATRYSGIVRRLTDPEITAMYRTEHLSAKIVDVYPREALREGFELGGYDDDNAKTDIEDDIRTYLGRWYVTHCVRNAAIWGRAYGGAAIWMGSLTADPSKPFVMGEKIDFLRTIDRRYLQPRPWSLDAQGRPTFYDIIPHEGGAMVGPIHVSRLVIFRGAMTDEQTYQSNNFWDDSVLQRPYEALQSDGIVWRSAQQMISEASLGVLKIKGLYSKLTGPARQALESRLALFNATRSIARNITLDFEGEDYKRESVTFAGIPDLTRESITRVASSAEMPVSILLSDEPSGLNATGDASIRWWLMRVHAYRTGDLERPLLYLCKCLLAQSDVPGVTPESVETLTVRWPELWTPSASEQAEIYSKTATADSTYFDMGVLDAKAIVMSRFGEDGYSQETTVDRDAFAEPSEDELRAAAEGATGSTGGTGPAGDEAAPAAKPGEGPAGENVQAQVLNGAQVASLVDIVAQVADGKIPRDAGVEIIMLAYQVDKPKAELLMGTAGTSFEPTKDPAPVPFGGKPGVPPPKPGEAPPKPGGEKPPPNGTPKPGE